MFQCHDAGVSWWKRPTRGSKTFNQRHEWICFRRNFGPTVWTKIAHSATGRCPREGTMLCRAAKADATSLQPAIPARISSTKRGRITNCATNLIRSKRFKTILASRSSFAGFTGSRKERSSEPDVTEAGPISLTDKLAIFVRVLSSSP